VAGRLLVGIGIGISAVVVPSYLGEVAPAEARGRIVEVYEVRGCGPRMVLAVVTRNITAAAVSCAGDAHGVCTSTASCHHAVHTTDGPCVEQVLLCLGMLLAVAADVLVDWLLHHSFGAWRWMVGLPIVPALLMSGMSPWSSRLG